MSNLIKNQDIISIIHLYLNGRLNNQKLIGIQSFHLRLFHRNNKKKHDIKLKVNKSEQCIEVEASA